MGEQYSQTLISRKKDFVPSAGAVGQFLAEVVELGVVPGKQSIGLSFASGKTREVLNPFSGGMMSLAGRTH